jgi:thiaminase
MIEAGQAVAETKARLKSVEERIRAHPYLELLQEGRIPRDRLRIFTGEQYLIINSDLRSIALLVHRHSHLPSRDYLLGSLQTEARAMDLLFAFAHALEMDETRLLAYEPLTGCQTYPAFVAWLALYGSDADFAAAFLVNLGAWGANCARMSAALKAKYSFPAEALAFLDFFAQPAPQFEADSLRVIQQGLDRGLDPRSLARAARLIQAYELMFWDTLYDASK